MDKFEALKIDTDFLVDFESAGVWEVLGDVTTFVYASFPTREEADECAKNMQSLYLPPKPGERKR